MLSNYVLVLLFEVCVHAENEFGLKDYDMQKTSDGFDGLKLDAGLRSGHDRLQQRQNSQHVDRGQVSTKVDAGESERKEDIYVACDRRSLDFADV